MMDEWADEDGNITPLSYKAGFGYAFEKFMVSQIMDLGFKREYFIYHSNELTPVYSKMLQDDGEADIVYSGPGWHGHLAFIDPVEDWLQPTMEEYLQQGAKVAHLHPLTIAQNSLHGGFGCSGDISRVPPMGAMMGSRDATMAKNVLDMHGITTAGSQVAWQRLTSRLCIFGEPDQRVLASILQLRDKPTHMIMSENIGATIEDDEFFQYGFYHSKYKAEPPVYPAVLLICLEVLFSICVLSSRLPSSTCKTLGVWCGFPMCTFAVLTNRCATQSTKYKLLHIMLDHAYSMIRVMQNRKSVF